MTVTALPNFFFERKVNQCHYHYLTTEIVQSFARSQKKMFRVLQNWSMNITFRGRRSSVGQELRGVVVDGARDAPALDAVLVLAVP